MRTVVAPRQVSSNEKIQLELEIIARKFRGNLPAKAVVEFARDPKTALHAQFTWDDGEAAEKWRVHQARVLIATITIEPRPNVVVRAWCNLPTDRASGKPVYRPTLRVMSDTDLRAELLQTVKDELGRLRAKHADLSELASVWKAIDQASGAA